MQIIHCPPDLLPLLLQHEVQNLILLITQQGSVYEILLEKCPVLLL